MVWQSETQSNKLSEDTVGIPLAPGNAPLKIILTGGRKILNWGEVFTIHSRGQHAESTDPMCVQKNGPSVTSGELSGKGTLPGTGAAGWQSWRRWALLRRHRAR